MLRNLLRVGVESEVSRVPGDSPLEGMIESGVFLSLHSYRDEQFLPSYPY